MRATEAAFKSGELRPLERGSAAYMMSKQQYLGDRDQHWHPHVMFFTQGDATKEWGADLPDSPVIAANDPEEHVTILFVVADKWSDGTPGPAMGKGTSRSSNSNQRDETAMNAHPAFGVFNR